MGSYISLKFNLKNVNLSTSVLKPVFTSSFFTPVGIGGIEAHEKGDNWLIQGYALEDFIIRFLKGGASKPASIEVLAKQNSEEGKYLFNLSDSISHLKVPFRELSPFEIEDPIAGVTSIRPVRLQISHLEELEPWISRFPKCILYIYGYIKVAVKNTSELPWNRAFRFLFPPEYGLRAIGAPLFFIRAGTSPFLPDTVEITIYSESTIWLQSCQALNNQVGQKEADENLAGFASVARLFTQAGGIGGVSAELLTDGPFNQELSRLKSAFSDILNCSETLDGD